MPRITIRVAMALWQVVAPECLFDPNLNVGVYLNLNSSQMLLQIPKYCQQLPLCHTQHYGCGVQFI